MLLYYYPVKNGTRVDFEPGETSFWQAEQALYP